MFVFLFLIMGGPVRYVMVGLRCVQDVTPSRIGVSIVAEGVLTARGSWSKFCCFPAQ